MKFLRNYDGRLFFDFTCEVCGTHGELGIPEEHALRPINCPEECGAVYLISFPDHKTMALTCAGDYLCTTIP